MARISQQIIAVGLAVVFLFGFLYLIPARPEICQFNSQTNHEDCAAYHLSPFILIEIFKFLNDYSAAISALAAAFIGIFTWQLKRSTDTLREGGDLQLAHLRNSSERQLRAYMFIDDPRYRRVEMNTWNVSFQTKNFGQTPAHNVRVIFCAAIIDWNGGQPNIPDPDIADTYGSIAPHKDFIEREADVSGNATSVEISQTRAIFLSGRILYRHVFSQEDMVTHFRYYVGPDTVVGLNDGELYADATGNDAT